MTDMEVRLAATLYALLYEAHTIHGSTTGPRGGIGGAAMTPHCHVIDPYPSSMYWTQYDLPSEFLREWLRNNPDVDIRAESAALQKRWLGQLTGDAE